MCEGRISCLKSKINKIDPGERILKFLEANVEMSLIINQLQPGAMD